MPRVVGIDVGTSTADLCGLDDGQVFLAMSLPTQEALRTPAVLVDLLRAAGQLDLVVGPSGYGVPLKRGTELTSEDLALAVLSPPDEPGGIGGFRALVSALAGSSLPVTFTPGVVHLPSVPAYRKVNRVDMGTADKVCAAALAVHQRARETASLESDVSFLFLETGGAFSAALAVQHGAIVDGMGGTSGPIGMAAAGALDGEVAFLAGHVTKATLFSGGARFVAASDAGNDAVTTPATEAGRTAWAAYVEGAVKSLAALATSVPGVRDVVLSGRLADNSNLRRELTLRLAPAIGKPVITPLKGFTPDAKQGAQGAALIADGLAGGSSRDLVETMRLREASGTVLDHLFVVSREAARRRLGLA